MTYNPPFCQNDLHFQDSYFFSVSDYTWIKKEMSRRYGEWKWVTGGLIAQQLLFLWLPHPLNFPVSWASYVSLLSWWTTAEASAQHWHYWGQGQPNQADFHPSSLRSCSSLWTGSCYLSPHFLLSSLWPGLCPLNPSTRQEENDRAKIYEPVFTNASG